MFTPDQKTLIVRILQITPRFLDSQLAYLGTDLTADIQTAVVDELDRWDAGAGRNFTRIQPKDANFGAEINPEDAKSDIRANIAVLLELPTGARSGGGMSAGTLRIGR